MVVRGVGGTGAGQLICKKGTIFIKSLTLTEPFFNNLQENGFLGKNFKLSVFYQKVIFMQYPKLEFSPGVYFPLLPLLRKDNFSNVLDTKCANFQQKISSDTMHSIRREKHVHLLKGNLFQMSLNHMGHACN